MSLSARVRPARDPGAVRQDAAANRVRLGVVVLTMGDRPADLAALLDSVLAQDGPPMHIVVVGNGCVLPSLPPGVQGVGLAENLGVPGGRNAALAALREHRDVDVVMYLDDDGLLPDQRTAERVREAFAGNPQLGIVSFRAGCAAAVSAADDPANAAGTVAVVAACQRHLPWHVLCGRELDRTLVYQASVS